MRPGTKVIVVWDLDREDLRDAFGCPAGTIVSQCAETDLYTVEHVLAYDGSPYTLYYHSGEISSKLIYRLIHKAHNKKIIDMYRVMKYRHTIEEIAWTFSIALMLTLVAYGCSYLH